MPNSGRRPLTIMAWGAGFATDDVWSTELNRAGFDGSWVYARDEKQLRRHIEKQAANVLLIEQRETTVATLAALRTAQEATPLTPVVVVGDRSDDESIVTCVKNGAVDYVTRTQSIRFGDAIKRALAEATKRQGRFSDRLRHAQRLETIGALAGGVAHNFGNLLTAIMGSSGLIRAQMPDDHTLGRSLDTIDSAVNRGSAIARALSTLCCRVPPARERLSLNEMLSEAAEFLRSMLPSAIDLQIALPPSREAWVEGDHSQLHQVLLNLAANARTAMPDGGELSVRMHFDSNGSLTLPGKAVYITVRDTGCGMSPEKLRRVLGPLSALDAQNERVGLGLAVAMDILRDHGGAMNCRSTLGEGTTFTIALPTVDAAAVPDILPQARGDGETILVIEGQPYLSEIISASLADAGYDVLATHTGAESVALCASHDQHIAAAIVETDLPDMGGLECLRRLREGKVHFPAVLTVGCSSAEFEDDLPDDVLVIEKPVQVGELARLMGVLVRRQRRAAESQS